jgi:hypothetical protein
LSYLKLFILPEGSSQEPQVQFEIILLAVANTKNQGKSEATDKSYR